MHKSLKGSIDKAFIEEIKKSPKRDMKTILGDYREDMEEEALVKLIMEFIEAEI